jgi:hypothetical protein
VIFHDKEGFLQTHDGWEAVEVPALRGPGRAVAWALLIESSKSRHVLISTSRHLRLTHQMV